MKNGKALKGKVSGKYYIAVNLPSSQLYCWDHQDQNWTTNPRATSFYMTEALAEADAQLAQRFSEAEVIVLRATKDLPNPEVIDAGELPA